MKHHYLIDTHHGPLVVADCGDHWIVTSPTHPPEIYDGRIPADRLLHATPISAERADEILDEPLLPGARRRSAA